MRNVVLIIGAIVALLLIAAAVVVALCFASSPTDHTPVATQVLGFIGMAILVLVAHLKNILESNKLQAKASEVENKVETMPAKAAERAAEATRDVLEKSVLADQAKEKP